MQTQFRTRWTFDSCQKKRASRKKPPADAVLAQTAAHQAAPPTSAKGHIFRAASCVCVCVCLCKCVSVSVCACVRRVSMCNRRGSTTVVAWSTRALSVPCPTTSPPPPPHHHYQLLVRSPSMLKAASSIDSNTPQQAVQALPSPVEHPCLRSQRVPWSSRVAASQ